MPVISSGQITLTDLNDTRQLILFLNGNYKTQVYDANLPSGTDTSYAPNFASTNVTITPELFIAGGNGSNLLPSADVVSVTWYEGTQTTTALTESATNVTSPAGYTYTIPTGAATTTAKVLTLKSNLKTANNQIYTCVVVYRDAKTGFNVTAKAQFEILKITNGLKGSAGVNAITVVMQNESANVPTDSAGSAASGVYTATTNQIHVYEGTTALAYDGVGTAAGTFKITQGTVTGISAGAITDGGTYAAIGAASNMTADVATVEYTIDGKRADNTAFTAKKVMTFSKSKTGVAPVAYWMTVSSHVIQKNVSNVFNPTTITITGFSQQGTAAPASTAIFKFRTDVDSGSGFVNGTATAALASTTYSSFPAGLKAVRFRLYQSSVTPNDTNFIDEVIVPVVFDGATGIDSHYLNVWCPNGDTIRNSAGSIDIQADMYKGAGQVTPSAFQWYVQDPSATIASGGNADGGDGWRLITAGNAASLGGITNYTTAKITVPAAAIAGVEGFKCVATFGSKYTGVTIVRDFQDPVSVNILGTNVFKNGEGSVTLNVQLLQAGVEISNAGYTFAWALYNAAGGLIKTYAGTTDTITVPATDVSGTANLVVDVSK